MIDIENYKNIELQDLIDEIAKYESSLSTLKATLKERENKVLKAFENHDLNALKNALANNSKKTISNLIWGKLNFNNLKDINFYNYVISLPEYELNKYDFWKTHTKQEDAVIHSLTNKESFDFFKNSPEFYSEFNKIISDEKYLLTRHVSKDVIHELIHNGILNVNDELMYKIWNKPCLNYLEYIIENNLYNISQDSYKELYLFSWDCINLSLREVTKRKILDLKKINLSEVVNKIEVLNSTKENNQYKLVKHEWLQFMRSESSLVLSAIKDHSIDRSDIENILSFFQYGHPKNEDFNTLHQFVDIILFKKPEFINDLKNTAIQFLNHCYDKNLEIELRKALNYIELNCELDSKGGSGKKIVKV